MNILGKLSRFGGAVAISAALMLPAGAALASQDGRNTTLGAVTGAVAGGLLTHGSAGGLVGGALVGGVAGHVLTRHRHYHGYRHYRSYRHDDHHRRWCNDHYC